MIKDFDHKKKHKNTKFKPRIETIRLDYDTIEQSKVLKTEGNLIKTVVELNLESDIPEMMNMFDLHKNTATIINNNSLCLNENKRD
jgi:hypothetical protein